MSSITFDARHSSGRRFCLWSSHCRCLCTSRFPFSEVSHFLTTNADPYMNGAFQDPSTAEDLARPPQGELQGIRGEGRRYVR